MYLSNFQQGQWTEAEQSLLKNSNLSAVGFLHRLDACVVLNMGTRVVTEKVMATTVEAIFAAAFLDGGEDALAAVVLTLGMTHDLLEAVMSYPSPRYK